DYTVGELAKRAGLTVRTLHHYEELGLLNPSGRSDAGYRRYSEADVLRLHRVLALRDAGVPLKDIVPLLDGETPQPLAA
ncbi:MerR family transcriptional regulator, partial [Escherichia coli]